VATALVTGATGFVGSWIARTLVEAGHDVRVLHRQTSRLDAIADFDVEHFIGDLSQPDALMKAVKGVDWVFHVAAVADYWRTGKQKIYDVNVDGTRTLLDVCIQAGVGRFIFTSSGAAIGFNADGRPVSENDHFSVDPRLSPYGHSKFLAEAEVYKAIQKGLDCVILNPSIVLGPGDLNLISGSLILEIAKGRVPFLPMQGGVTYVDVRDVAKAHLTAAEKGRCGERYLLGTVDMSNKAIIRLTAQIVGAKPPFIPSFPFMVNAFAWIVDIARGIGLQLPGDVEGNQLRLSLHDIYFDCSKAHRELGDPQIDLVQSITDTYEWYREHGYL
jgi:dihydroflavonol-4-reductase